MLYFSRWKTISIWLVVLLGAAVRRAQPLPAIGTGRSLPDWLPKQQMTLGLDLQGGSHILLQIDRQDLIDERLETTRDDIRTLLRDAKIGYTGLAGNAAARCRSASATPAELDAAKTALAVADCSRSPPGLFGGGIGHRTDAGRAGARPAALHADRRGHRLPHRRPR